MGIKINEKSLWASEFFWAQTGKIEELPVFESIVAEKLTARDPLCHLPTSFDRLVGFVKGKLCCQQRKLQCVSPLSNC